jgi:hypothetical protein
MNHFFTALFVAGCLLANVWQIAAAQADAEMSALLENFTHIPWRTNVVASVGTNTIAETRINDALRNSSEILTTT